MFWIPFFYVDKPLEYSLDSQKYFGAFKYVINCDVSFSNTKFISGKYIPRAGTKQYYNI